MTVTGAGDTNCPYAGEDRTICQGETTQIGCEPDPENPSPYCFKWEPEIGFVDEFGPMQESPTVKPEETTTYTLYVTDGNGSLIATEEVVVNVLASPSVEIEPNTALLCPGGNIQLNAIAEGEGTLSYVWSTGSIATSIQVSVAGTYSVSVTNEANCQVVGTVEVQDEQDPIEYANGIKAFFKNKGFFALPISIIGDDDPPVLVNDPNSNARSFGELVEDHALKFIQIKDATFNMAEVIDAFLQDEFYTDFVAKKAFLTKNENFCESVEGNANARLIDEIEHNFMSQELGYWIHVWENPGEGEDCLLIACRTPNHDVLSPATEERASFINSFLGIMAERSEVYTYASKSHQIADILFDQLADFYEFDLTPEFLVQSGIADYDPNDQLSGGPCGAEALQPIICLNPAGIPIMLPSGSTIQFPRQSEWRPDIDKRALKGFSKGRENFIAYGKKSLGIHAGYKNAGNPKGGYYPFPSMAEDCYWVHFGASTDYIGENNADCEGIEVYTEKYRSALSFSQNTPYWKGVYQADFSAVGGETNCSNLQGESRSYLYSSCIPHISKAEFDKAKQSASFNPFDRGGILFLYQRTEDILDENGNVVGTDVLEEKWIYSLVNTYDANEFEYYAWSCQLGVWEKYTEQDEAIKSQIFLLAAIFKATVEVLSGEVVGMSSKEFKEALHLGLDVVGFFPVIGTAADLVNGVWYIAEGNLGEGALTLIGAVPLIGDGYKLVKRQAGAVQKYFFEVKIAGLDYFMDIKTLGRNLCTTQLVSDPDLSVNLGISAMLFLPPGPGCVGSNVFKAAKLLEKAAEEGASFLEPDKAKELVQWITTAIETEADIGKAFEKYPDLIKVWKQADFSAFPDEKKKELLSWLGKLDPAKADELAVVNRFLERPELVRAWGILEAVGSRLSKNIDALSKIDFLKTKGLSDDQLKAIGELDDIKVIDLAESISKRNDFTSLIRDDLHQIAINAKAITNKGFANEIPNFMNDLKKLAENPNLINLEEFKAWLKDFTNKLDSGLELELQEALSIAQQNKPVHLGFNPRNLDGTLVLVRGNPVDIDVYNVADNVLIECKRTKTNFIDNLGKIGLKFNSETKLPAAVRDIEGRKLQGSLHVVDANVFQGALDRDDILYQILSYVQSNNPQSASRIIGLNRLEKLHIRIGNDIKYTYLRNEW